MNNKEYGIKLNADISKFVNKLTEAKTYTNEVMEDIKDKIKEPLETAGESTKQTFAGRIESIANLAGQVGELTLQYADAVSLEGKNSKSAQELKDRIKELNNEVEREGQGLNEITDALNDLYDEEEKVKTKTVNMKNIFSGLGQTIDKSVKKGVSSLKMFSMAMLGVRSAYFMLARAVRSYMAYDEKANARLQANWVALGAMFEPIVEKIVNLVQKLVAYINVFYKALTGKDFIQKTLDKVKNKANGASKEVKGLNKELANFDEITNLSFDAGQDNSFGIAEALEDLKNIQLDPEITKNIEKLAEQFKTNLLPAVEALWNFIKDKLIPIVGEVYNKFDEWGIPLEGILFTIGLITGGINGGLLTAVGLFIAKIWEAYNVWKEFNKSEDRLYESRIEILNTHKVKLKEIQRELDELSKKQTLNKEEEKRQNELIKEKEWRISECQEQYDEFNEDIKNGKVYSREQAEEIKNIGKEIDNITKNQYTIDFNLDVELTNQAKNTLDEVKRLATISTILAPLMSLPLSMMTAPFIDSILNKNKSKNNNINALKNLPGFAHGNVAYGPTVAEFGEYAGARSNPEITTPQNIMRQTMIEALQEAMPQGGRGGDTVLYVNGKELARATYEDFQTEGNRLGTSNVAIRRV